MEVIMIGRNKIGDKIVRILIAVILIATLIPVSVFAASSTERHIYLEMADTSLQMGVGTSMSLVLENVDQNAEIVDFKGLDNFEIVSHSQSQSSSNINGQLSKAVRVDYTIMPKAVGTYNLQAVLKIAGQSYETNQLTVVVEEQDTELSEVNEDIFLKTSVSKNQLYFGESAVVTYDLYSRYQIDQYGFKEAIEADGFVIEEGESSGSGSSFIMINGKKYAKYTAKQLIISPTDIGEYTLPAYDFQANISTGNFFGESKPMYLKSDPVSFTVKALPSSNRPEPFSGLTGDFELNYDYDQTKVPYGEPLTLNVTISGQGNLYLLDSIADEMDLKDFTVYETEQSAESTSNEKSYNSTKHYEIILMPKKAGTLIIPKLALSYFNTVDQKYDQLVIDSKTIEVAAKEGDEASNDMPSRARSTMVTEPLLISQVDYGTYGDDYMVIALPKSLVKNSMIALVPFLIVIISAIYGFKKKRHRNSSYMKSLRASKDEGGLYEFFARYMQEEYKISIRSMTTDAVRIRLQGLDELDEIVGVLTYFNDGRYQQSQSLSELKEKIKSIIRH